MVKFFYAKRIALPIVVLLLLLCVVLCACVEETVSPADDAMNVTFSVCDKDGVVLFERECSTKSAYLSELLGEMAEQQLVICTTQTGTYGEFITKVDVVDVKELAPTANEYIAIYHDIDDVTLYFPDFDKEVNGVVYRSSSAGASALPIKDGAKYMLCLSSY